jgi:uncharacterized protein (TIGR03437 family)
MFRKHFSTVLQAGLALSMGAGILTAATAPSPHTGAAATLIASGVTNNAVTLSCDTVVGPTALTINLLLATGAVSTTVTPSLPLLTPLGTAPAAATVGSTTVPVPFVFSIVAGCVGVTNNQTVAITLTPGTGTALVITATLTLTTVNGSALAATPSSVNITCSKSGSVYTPGSAKTVAITSPANLGTPFTIDNAVNVLPSWLAITPSTLESAPGPPVVAGTPQTAGTTAVTLTFTAVALGCATLPVGNTSFTVHLLNAPATDKLLVVTIQVGGATPLASSVATIALTHTKGVAVYTPVTSNISSGSSAYFTVDPTTIPLWLSVSPLQGSTASPVVVSFTPTTGAETLALGSYTASVHFKVSGDLDLAVPVTLQVSNPAATVTVAEGITRAINWTIGTALPTIVITPVSSDSPVAFTVATAGALNPQVNSTHGLAYSFGTPIQVSFLQSVLSSLPVSATPVVGTVTITPSGLSAIVVTINLTVQAASALTTGLSPSALPTATSGSYTVALSGSGFVTGGGVTGTIAGVVTNGAIVYDAYVVPTVSTSTTINFVITVPVATDPYLPFTGAGGSVTIGVCNPVGGVACSVPTSTQVLIIGINPIVAAVTSASSFIEVTPPALPTIAPYDVLSVFGSNFCVSSGTGCVSPNSTLMYGTTDPVTLRYLTTLTPDASTVASKRYLSVTFYVHGTQTVIGTAPLLFASNNQINMISPAALATYIGSTVDMVVSFGYGTGATLLKSSVFTVNVAATDPGIFTIGGDGQGSPAALSSAYAVITNSAPAIARNVSASDTISMYVTGLGVPDSDHTTGTWSATCMTVAYYFGLVNSADGTSLLSDDGLVLQSILYPAGYIAPCFKSTGTNAPSVTVGGTAIPSANITYAGWVPDSVAGLYQINFKLPASTVSFTNSAGTAAVLDASGATVQLPVVVTTGGKTSQPTGVNLAVAPGLLVTATGSSLALVSGVETETTAASSVMSSITLATADGTGSITYSSGSLPAGLTLSSGVIAGTPTTQATTVVVFTGTDTNGVTGTISITFVIT